MRVLRIFFTALVLILAVGAIGVFLGREILLSTAINQLRTDIRELKQAHIDPQFVSTCLEYGGPPVESPSLVRTQLRFTSPTQYLIETVCQSTESLRTTLRSDSLPPLVTKGVGQSGVVDGQTPQGLTVTVMGRTGGVYRDEEGVRGSSSSPPPATVALTDGPPTVCAGYGFTCCNELTQVGQGDQQPAALDCPRSCHSQCAQKPVVVAFQSDPILVPDTRILAVRSGQTAEFFYTVSDITDTDVAAQLNTTEASSSLSRFLKLLGNTLLSPRAQQDQLQGITLVFGDGQSATVSDLQGVVEHTYTCTRALCVYNATIQAVTQSGITSTLTADSRIQVQVSP